MVYVAIRKQFLMGAICAVEFDFEVNLQKTFQQPIQCHTDNPPIPTYQ
jgi:hypothetical protein